MEDYCEQLSLFDDILTEYKVTKPMRLISFFSGIEAQYKALSFLGKKLGVKVESYKTCEWAYNSIVACNAIHNRDFTDYSEGKTKEETLERIRGISIDYNKPLTDDQLDKKSIAWIKNAYNCCIANHNLINIMDVHAKDLEIVEQDKYEYMLTYSFPCQDLSLAGQRAGMDVSQSDGGTRSGLLWEVERILKECKEQGTLPNTLIMENVPQIHSEKDMPNFRKWIIALERMGYNNYWEDLNAKDFGVPQNRTRCFMVSILGKDYNYKFPYKFKRELTLKDMLEDNVDEKYFLSQKMVDYLTGINQKESKYDRAAVFERNLDPNKDCAATITTCAGQRPTDNFVIDGDVAIIDDLYQNRDPRVYTEEAPTLRAGRDGLKVVENNDDMGFVEKKYKQYMDEHNGEIPEMFNPYNATEITDVAPTQTTQSGSTTSSATILISEKGEEQDDDVILIRENNSVGYKEAKEGDGINISTRMHHNRGNVQDGMAQTLKTVMEVGVVVDDDEPRYGRAALNETIKEHKDEIQDGTFIDAYNKSINNDVAGTLTTKTNSANNTFVAQESQNMKEQLCDYLIENELVEEGDCVNHSYSSSRMEEPTIANKEFKDCSPTLTTRVDTLGVVVNENEKEKEENESVITEMEAQLFTEDGNVRRYIGSEQIDIFEEGDMATTSFPNGYGHGPRTHKDCSITLNTIDKPVVKKNLRIRKLTPKEAVRLMAFQDIDCDHMYEAKLSDAAIYHVCGDSICVNVLLGIMAKLYGLDNFETINIIKDYISTLR